MHRDRGEGLDEDGGLLDQGLWLRGLVFVLITCSIAATIVWLAVVIDWWIGG